MLLRRAGYSDLPVSLRGSPGAMGRFRVLVEPWAVFGFLVAAMGVLLAIGWLRRVVSQMGPE